MYSSVDCEYISIDIFHKNGAVTETEMPDTKDIEESLKIAVKRRGNLRRIFTVQGKKINTLLQQDSLTDENIEALKLSQQKLLEVKPEIKQLDIEIQRLLVILENEEASDKDFEESDVVSDDHAVLLSHLEKALIQQPKLSAKPQKEFKHSSLKLPKIVLPVFDGDRRKWFSFWDVFRTEVHEVQDISNVTKFNFLKGQLSDKIKKRVEGIMASDDNYELLVQTLVDNYGNKTAIKNAHCVALVFIPKPQYTAASLRGFYDNIMSDIRSLEALKLPRSKYGEFYVPILIEKLPEQLLADILKEHPNDNPTMDQLTTMIHNEVKKLEHVAYINFNLPRSKVQQPSKLSTNVSSFPETSTATALSATVTNQSSQSKKSKPFKAPRKITCKFCAQAHNTFQCELSVNERMLAVQNKKLCVNCLNTNHSSDQCQSKWRCTVCRQPHHTTLHGATALQASSHALPRCASSVTQAAVAMEIIPHCDEHVSSIILQLNQRNQDTTNGVNLNEPPNSCHSKYSDGASRESTNVNYSQPNTDTVLLKTAVAKVKYQDVTCTANIFFDEGSSLSYISTKLADELHVAPNCKKTLQLNTFGGKTHKNTFQSCSIGIVSDDGDITVDTIIQDVIISPINRSNWSSCLNQPHLKNINLADDLSQTHFQVDILIGLDSVWQFLKPEVISGCPTAQASNLGYVLSGKLNPNSSSNDVTFQYSSVNQPSCMYISPDEPNLLDDTSNPTGDNCDFDLHELVSKLLQIESFDLQESNASPEDKEFIQRFQSQIENRNGTYFVPLPWLDNHSPLPSNLHIALSRLEQVKKRLLKLGLFESYSRIIFDQINKGYVEPVQEDDGQWDEVGSHYLSHFFVLRPDSETTPLRVVFAANAGQVSLNDCLYTGPCLLKSLHTILHRFRVNRYAFIADIEKAFLRIKLKEEHRDFVRFLWYKDGDPNKPLQVYRYTSVFFGGTSSPFILNSTVQHHLSRHSDDVNPEVVQVANDLEQKLYCDNLLSGVDDETEASQYYKVSRQIMQDADMNLRQWSTNSTELNKLIDEDKTGSQRKTCGVLGLKWNPEADTIQLQQRPVMSHEERPCTKRQVLSSVSSVFDPIGFISPVVVPGKVFVSTLWQRQFDWDETLPIDLQEHYHKIASEIESATEFSFKRHLNFDKTLPIEMHVFCDASPKVAAACCVYFVQNDNVEFIASKFKIASTKFQRTVPQWEMVAMEIGARLAETIKDIYKDDFPKIVPYYWTDALICLQWLSTKRQLKVFVQNRKTAILKLSELSNWAHVRSSDNPADILSRGCTAKELERSELWKKGPTWLTQHHVQPTQQSFDLTEEVFTSSAAVAKEYCNNESTETSNCLGELFDIPTVKSYERLLRVLAYCLRFIAKLKKSASSHRKGILESNLISQVHDSVEVPTSKELNNAEIAILKMHQAEHFKHELNYLNNVQNHSLKSKPNLVRQLNLAVNDDGLIVARGRLEYSSLQKESKEPILIAKSQLITLIIQSIHSRQLHTGVGGTVVALRKKLWLSSARQVVKSILRKCVTCRYQESKPYCLPSSPPLPEFRLNSMKPFQVVGIDFTGHLVVKNCGKKHTKCYICLFACSTTRNVNLEVVNDMSTDQFLQAFRRHCAVYGVPSLILCDNAKTFIKADEELCKLLQSLDDPKVQAHLSNKRILMRRIPNKSPHWGGMYERLIGIVKMCLKKVLHRALICLSELQTLVKEVQAVVNDRPMTFISSDIDDPQPLTPSKLLYGFDVTALPHPHVDTEDLADDYKDQGEMNRAMKRRALLFQHFNQRFKTEYLAALRERHTYQQTKRRELQEIIKVGDVVLINNRDLPRINWKLAVVKKLLRGPDGKVRAAELHTSSGGTNRSIHLLHPLEVQMMDPKEYFSSPPQVSAPLRRSKRLQERQEREDLRGPQDVQMMHK